LDHELVRRGLVSSRQQAQAAVAAGQVLVAGAVADKAARLVAAGEPLVVRGGGPRFVSRGGEKLEAALERFAVEVAGRRAIDAGASTGGFTDCLLQRGATSVVAVDVGHGQLDARLRADPRVVVRERTNLRTLSVDDLGVPEEPGGPPHPFVPVDLLTADLSFISLSTVAPVLCGPVVTEGADLIVLVKPQFEAGRAEISRGRGVVRDPSVWRAALLRATSALGATGTGIMGVVPSVLTGASGNTEFFVHASARRAPDPGARRGQLEALVDLAVDEAIHGATRRGER
jgi:23S rRNA (cytidine1920-2'-O)/16S rRNA (cytidine1409-2'-O)-methyltransferase